MHPKPAATDIESVCALAAEFGTKEDEEDIGTLRLVTLEDKQRTLLAADDRQATFCVAGSVQYGAGMNTEGDLGRTCYYPGKETIKTQSNAKHNLAIVFRGTLPSHTALQHKFDLIREAFGFEECHVPIDPAKGLINFVSPVFQRSAPKQYEANRNGVKLFEYRQNREPEAVPLRALQAGDLVIVRFAVEAYHVGQNKGISAVMKSVVLAGKEPTILRSQIC